MLLFDELKKAIKRNNSGAIDALMYVSKIEYYRNKSFNYNEFKNEVAKYYKAPSKEHTLLYEPSELIKFYQPDEISISEGELISDKIESRMSFVDSSINNFWYKRAYFKIITKYLESIGASSNQAASIKFKERLTILTSIALILGIVATSMFALILKSKFEMSTDSIEMYLYVITYFAYPYIILTYAIWFNYFMLDKSRFSLKMSTVITVLNFIIILPSLMFILNPSEHYKEATAQVKSVINYDHATHIKEIQFIDSEGTELTALGHKNLNLQMDKAYRIKYSSINEVVFEAIEISDLSDLNN